MQGFLAKAFAFDYDVCTFATYRKYQDTSEREVGETSIFSLIDYDASMELWYSRRHCRRRD